jgi:hypothetical protein
MANVNDLMSGGGLSLATWTAATKDQDDVSGGPCHVKFIHLFCDSATCQMDFKDAATAAAVDLGDMRMGGVASDTVTIEFPGLGYPFLVGLSGLLTTSATAPLVLVYYRLP